jgi:hypothetical protein
LSNVELHDFIKFIKEEVKKSETEKPEKGFWIGAQSLEMTFETVTEVNKKGGLKIYLLSAEREKKQKSVQTVKINFVTQAFEPVHPVDVSRGKMNW